MTESDAQELIDGAVDPTPALATVEPTDYLVQQLTDDVARAIMTYPEIAARYGLTVNQLYKFIARPEIRRLTKTKRALWLSDNAASERLKAYWTIGMIEAAPHTLAMLTDPAISAAAKIELTKIGARITGLDGAGARAATDGGPAPGQHFSVNIMFSGREETIITTGVKTTPLLEGEAA